MVTLAFGAIAANASHPTLTVVLYSDLAISGSLDQAYRPSQESSCAYAFDCENIVRTAKALHRYFEARTDTAGKDIRMFAVQSIAGIGSSCAARESDSKTVVAEFSPDLVAHLGTGMECFVQEIARAGIPTFGFNGLARKDYTGLGPLVWTFSPSAEAQAELSAGYICNKLADRNARFAGDPTMRTRARSFGLIVPDASNRGTEFDVQSLALQQELAERCGLTPLVEPFVGSTLAGINQANDIMTDFREAGVTTVVCHCVPLPTELSVSPFQAAAASIGYLPEWYWDTPSFMDRASWQKLFQSKVPGASFGWTWLWRVPELAETEWYQAYRSQEPESEPNGRHLWSLYHTFWLTYEAIKAGNPTHNPNAIENGLFSLSVGAEDDPYHPLGSFGPAGPEPYALVDTGMGFWWDETGTPPGGIPAQGCIRVTNEGLRASAAGWPAGDDDVQSPADPCSQATQRIYVL